MEVIYQGCVYLANFILAFVGGSYIISYTANKYLQRRETYHKYITYAFATNIFPLVLPKYYFAGIICKQWKYRIKR